MDLAGSHAAMLDGSAAGWRGRLLAFIENRRVRQGAELRARHAEMRGSREEVALLLRSAGASQG